MDKHSGPPTSIQMDRTPFSGVPLGGCRLVLCCLCSDYLGYSFQGFTAGSNFLGFWDLSLGKVPDYLAQFFPKLATPQNHLRSQVFPSRPVEAPGRGLGICTLRSVPNPWCVPGHPGCSGPWVSLRPHLLTFPMALGALASLMTGRFLGGVRHIPPT